MKKKSLIAVTFIVSLLFLSKIVSAQSLTYNNIPHNYSYFLDGPPEHEYGWLLANLDYSIVRDPAFPNESVHITYRFKTIFDAYSDNITVSSDESHISMQQSYNPWSTYPPNNGSIHLLDGYAEYYIENNMLSVEVISVVGMASNTSYSIIEN